MKNKNNIKRLSIFDLDGSLMNTFGPEEGKPMWEKHYDKKFSWNGWWSKPESLDLNVFDIKPFPNVLKELKEDQSKLDTYIVVLTSRMEKLRPEVQKVLDVNGIYIDKLDMKHSEKTKGEKILRYIQQFPDLEEINVYEDRDIDIESYKTVKNQIPKNIVYNIYLVVNGKLNLLEVKNKLLNIINEETQDFVQSPKYKKNDKYE